MDFKKTLRDWGLIGAMTAGTVAGEKPAEAQERPETAESDETNEWSASATPPSEPTGFTLNIGQSRNTVEATTPSELAESEPLNLEAPLEDTATTDMINNYRRYQSADGRKYFVDYQNRATRLFDATHAEIFISEDDDHSYYVIINDQRLPITSTNFLSSTLDTRGISEIAGRRTNVPLVAVPEGYEFDMENNQVVPIGTPRNDSFGPSSLAEFDQQGGRWE